MNPMVIVACVQAAVAVAGMLAPKGPDLSDLLVLQMQMLKNISNQIVKLQEGINIIIQDIDSLKKYVEYELPSEVYKQFVKNEVISFFSGYERIISTYFEERETKGIFKATERNRDKLTKVLLELQHKRDQLLDVNDYFLTPIIARCFKIETDLLIVLSDDEGGGISSAYFRNSLKGYEDWLIRSQAPTNIYSVDYSINKFIQSIDSANVNTFGFRMCRSDVTYEKKNDPNQTGYSEKFGLKVNVEFFSFLRAMNPDIEKQLLSNRLEKDDLIRIYNSLLIDQKYLPNVVTQTVDTRINKEVLDLIFVDEFLFPQPGDGFKGSRRTDRFEDTRFDVDRSFLFALNKCDNPSLQILTNKKYFESSQSVEENGKKIVVPISQKKIMLELHDGISALKKLI